jgi:L-fuculose-phosphate aldolase
MESGSREYAAHALAVMGERRAIIMANHGLLAIGETVERALESIAYAEEGARVFLLARAHGEPSTHPKPSSGMMYAPPWWRDGDGA